MSGMHIEVIEEFRANKGFVGGFFEKMPILILHHVGAKSGKAYEMPLAYVRDGERLVVCASKGGAAAHPQWYHNLVANPDVKIEVATDNIVAKAIDVKGAERGRLYDVVVEAMPAFGEFREKADREIPVIAFEPA